MTLEDTPRITMDLKVKDAQRIVDDWVRYYAVPYWPTFEQLTHLAEEVGELAKELLETEGSKPKKPTDQIRKSGVQEEMGDVLFTLICLANSHDIDLEDAFVDAMHKCYKRDSERFKKK